MSVAEASSPPTVPWWKREVLWLVVMVAAFFAFSLYAGIVAFFNFQLSNSVDAGIITQAVASTSNGGVPPFFESYDCVAKARCSFLLVHPAFVLYLTVPAFQLVPTTITLFAIRSAIVAAAAIPLFWLTRQLTDSNKAALLAAAVYLVWAPTSTDDFSLHMETFLPLEILLLVALWQAGHYRWGLLVAGATFATIEVGPVFTFLVGVFFLVPPFAGIVRGSWSQWRSGTAPALSLRTWFDRWRNRLRSGLKVPAVRYSLVLMGASVAAYVFLYSFMNVWGAHVLGVPPPPTGTGLSGFFYNSSTPSIPTLPTILTSSQTLTTAEYWILLYALLAFIPLLSPRALVLIVPWIGWTFLSDSSRFTTLGHQYSFIAAGPLMVGFAFGLAYLLRGPLAPRPEPAPVPSARTAPFSLHRPTRKWAVFGTVVGVVIVANVLMSPVSPILSELGYRPGGFVEGTYFQHSLVIEPGLSNVEQMLGLVPPHATIGVADQLYALLAPHAGTYVLPHRVDANLTLLPFNVTSGPDFFLVNTGEIALFDPHDSANFSTPSAYGMRAYVASTGIGTVWLYARNYSGVAEAFGPPLAASTQVWSPGDGLYPGAIGNESENQSAPYGFVIETDLASHRTGQVWTTGGMTLAPGNYSVTVQIAVTGVNGTVRPGSTVLYLVGHGFDGEAFSQNFTFASIPRPGWAELSFNVSLPNPEPQFLLDGYLRNADVSIAVASAEMVPIGSD